MPRRDSDTPQFDDHGYAAFDKHPQLERCAKGPDTPMDAEHCLPCKYLWSCHTPGMVKRMQEAR